MSYYEPKIFAYLMMFTSLLNAIAYPIMGYLVTRIMFTMMELTYDISDTAEFD